MNKVETGSSAVVSRGMGREERGKGVVASSLHILQCSRWLETFVKKRQKSLL